MTKSEIAILWLQAFFGALSVVVGRLGYALFAVADAPPEDPKLLRHWKRKRLWLAFSEFAALPAFATIASVAALYWHLPVPLVVALSMVLGGVGFGALLNGVQRVAQRKFQRLEDEL